MTDATEVDFSGLILGLSSAALYYLGEAPIDGKVVPTKNIPLARQNIEIIRMLKAKTKGNLTGDEQSLLDQLLADLEIKFVDAVGKK